MNFASSAPLQQQHLERPVLVLAAAPQQHDRCRGPRLRGLSEVRRLGWSALSLLGHRATIYGAHPTFTPVGRGQCRLRVEGALAAGAQPEAVGEPGEEADQGERGDDGQADDGDAGGDGEDVAGVAPGVVDSPAAAARRSLRGAGLDPQRDARVVGAPVQLRQPARAGAAAWRRSPRSSASIASRSDSVSAAESWASRPSILARESCSCSSVATVGAVMSAVASWRVRTSSIAEKAASASPSLALGISRSKCAPAFLPAVVVECRTMPRASWTALKTLAESSATSAGSASRPISAERSISRWGRCGS